MRKNLAFMSLATLASIAEHGYNYNPENNFIKGRLPTNRKDKVIPKGCNEYHFTKSGHFDTADNKWNDIDYIFSCVASNCKVAIKKFNSFMRSNQAE